MTCEDCACSQACGSAPSAILPHKPAAQKASESSPLWSTIPARDSNDQTYGSVSSTEPMPSSTDRLPLTAPGRCEGNNVFRGGVCCRELKASDQRRLINPDLVRDVIIGLSDGLTVPFALTAGLSGVGSTRLVVIAGLAELVSGAISMGVGGFLSAQAELQHYEWTKRQTRERMARSCSSAVTDEINDILSPYGIPTDVAALVASKLRLYPDEEAEEKGLTPFILRLGEGLEPVSTSRAWQSAVTIGLSYFLGGLLPLFPYILLDTTRTALFTSIAVTGLVLMIFGVLKTKFTGGEEGLKGYGYGAVSTLAVGGLAAGASWLIVRSLEGAKESHL
ncbi:DUF125-domain-containing protein [Microstroma glucosiphilum]|uniref:DUF125-domain-containing protein n=1 Tax=Pseudomicrostroma glucosiphilum TaxID=1684307 RepID=A0A316U7B0_9BASI|nr:DUF125-domain-containing protein [Pseudomicrostroma glucosiphilum]PWN21120.1 DUF125-domain-containing protein [Pseudomicrostroma glucosiphilum]